MGALKTLRARCESPSRPAIAVLLAVNGHRASRADEATNSHADGPPHERSDVGPHLLLQRWAVWKSVRRDDNSWRRLRRDDKRRSQRDAYPHRHAIDAVAGRGGRRLPFGTNARIFLLKAPGPCSWPPGKLPCLDPKVPPLWLTTWACECAWQLVFAQAPLRTARPPAPLHKIGGLRAELLFAGNGFATMVRAGSLIKGGTAAEALLVALPTGINAAWLGGGDGHRIHVGRAEHGASTRVAGGRRSVARWRRSRSVLRGPDVPRAFGRPRSGLRRGDVLGLLRHDEGRLASGGRMWPPTAATSSPSCRPRRSCGRALRRRTGLLAEAPKRGGSV